MGGIKIKQITEVLKEKWVSWSCGVSCGLVLLMLLLAKSYSILFGLLFLCVGFYLLFLVCVWGSIYLKHISAKGIRIGIEKDKWYSSSFDAKKISEIEQFTYEKLNDMRKEKLRMKYASFLLPVLLIIFACVPHNTEGNSNMDESAKSDSTIVNTDETREEEPSNVESSTELEVKDWYTSYKNTFNLVGKCTPEAKVELLPIKGDVAFKTTYADKNGKFSINVDTSKTISFYVKVIKEGMTENHQPVSIDREYNEAEKIKNFVKEAKTPRYNQLKKNPDNFLLTKAVYKGKVIQALEDGGQTDLRISVSNLGYGVWSPSDVIYVTYDGKTPAAEDDIVTVYGTIMGKHNYQSQAGWDISVPLVVAEFIKMK